MQVFVFIQFERQSGRIARVGCDVAGRGQTIGHSRQQDGDQHHRHARSPMWEESQKCNVQEPSPPGLLVLPD